MTTVQTTFPPNLLHDAAHHHGIPVLVIGDDGDRLITLGHHDADAAMAAFLSVLGNDLDWTPLDLDAAAAAEPQRRWAALVTWCGRCGEDADCCLCKAIAEHVGQPGGWWLDWSAAEPTEGRFPVTVLDVS